MSNGSADSDKHYEVDGTLGGPHRENSVEEAGADADLAAFLDSEIEAGEARRKAQRGLLEGLNLQAEGTKENPDCNGLKIIDKGNPIEVVRGGDEKVATVQGITVDEMKGRDLLAFIRTVPLS